MIDQSYERAVPLTELHEWPGNPRRGDEAAIEASMAAHGFYGAVLVQRSSARIIAGNHRARVARDRGEMTVPVLWLDVDDDEAERIMLVDNRTNDTASYDNFSLLSALQRLDETEIGLIGTGYNHDDLAILASLDNNGGGDGDLDGDGRPQLGDMAYRIVVECDDEEHQAELIETFTSEGLTVRAVIN